MNFQAKNQNTKRGGENYQGTASKKTRIIVFDFHSPMMIEVVKALQAKSIEIVYWVASKGDFVEISKRKDIFPHTIFHNADDAAAGIPAPRVDARSFKPVDATILKEYVEAQVQSLVMMDGIDLTQTSVLKKVHLYNVYLKYWHGIFEMFRPDAIIFSDVPHMSFKYVAYCIAKRMGIRRAILRNTQIGGRMSIIDDIQDYKKLRAHLQRNEGKNFSLDDLSPDFRDYYNRQRNVDISPGFYRGDTVNRRAYGLYQFLPHWDSFKKNIRNLALLNASYVYIKMLFSKRRLPSLEVFIKPVWYIKLQERRRNALKRSFEKEYLQYQREPDLTKKYIYVALHNQPERSTGTEGGVFVDQILMIDLLSHSIPSDWVIYVKENRMQWIIARSHKGRFRGYTEEIVKNKNVFVVPVETSTFDLIKNAQAVAAVTSTAAWEAILRDKPALIFGYTWYMYCDGVLRISDWASCRDAIGKIKNGYKPNQQKVINFLKSADETTILGYLNQRTRDMVDLNTLLIKEDKKNIESLSRELYKELVE
ncbi:MAG: hypothetical protein Q8R36_05740 [bacterium]|nr:hypothetical protein [bacterium]